MTDTKTPDADVTDTQKLLNWIIKRASWQSDEDVNQLRINCDKIKSWASRLSQQPATDGWSSDMEWQRGQRVTKKSGSSWTGTIVGFYSTELTPEGYAVESDTEIGSVQIYPRKALELLPTPPAEPST